MNLRRVWTLVKTEVLHGPKDVVLVMAVVMPVLLALFVNLAFGNLFSSSPRLGVYDQGSSRLTPILSSVATIQLKTFSSAADLRAAAAAGSLDMGLVLPADFDSAAAAGTIRLQAYLWGESPARNRALIPVVLAAAVRQMTGAVVPVDIQSVPLGDQSSLPWSVRLLPVTVLMAVFFGGLMIPATSLINEKIRRTLVALSVTPASLGEIFAAKGLIGVCLAAFMGALTLLIGGRFGPAFPALLLVLALGALLAAEIGLLAGAFIKDINTLYAFWKFGSLILFGPAVVYIFPQVPQWLGYLFPTFYVIKPVMDLSAGGQGLGAVAVPVLVLVAIVALGALLVRTVVSRLSRQALSL